MGNYRNGSGGPAKGHVREAFLDATDAYMNWEDGDPEPTISFEGRPIPIYPLVDQGVRQRPQVPSGSLE